MSTATQETIAAEIRALPVKEKLHLAAGLLSAPRPDMAICWGTTMASEFGRAWPRLHPHFWWRYDITTGLAYTWRVLGRRGRFYGITIGRWCIGIVTTPKERSDGN